MNRMSKTLLLLTAAFTLGVSSPADAFAASADEAVVTEQDQMETAETSDNETTENTDAAETQESTENEASNDASAKTSKGTSKKKKKKKKNKNKKKNTYKKKRYARRAVAIKKRPSEKAKTIVTVKKNKKLKVGKVKNGWAAVKVNNKLEGYVQVRHLTKTKAKAWTGPILTRTKGAIIGPTGTRETYYNLRMDGVISIMSRYGYSRSDYKVRKDGVKTLDGYVMVAANLNKFPRGSYIETSLGTALVCDSCPAGAIDIAVTW